MTVQAQLHSLRFGMQAAGPRPTAPGGAGDRSVQAEPRGAGTGLAEKTARREVS